MIEEFPDGPFLFKDGRLGVNEIEGAEAVPLKDISDDILRIRGSIPRRNCVPRRVTTSLMPLKVRASLRRTRRRALSFSAHLGRLFP